MTVDDKLISRLSNLAKLAPTAEERERFRADLEKILAMVDKLSELDLADIEPLQYLGETQQKLREDQVSDQLSRNEALANAPQTDPEGQFFRVPKVINT
ncbi:MAG: Asp-tRNA(Asn)/Glu-tRNA(Gln) amidotransferase subunit GatC [Bacteroidota bacterium]